MPSCGEGQHPMDGNDGDLISPVEEDMNVILQTSHNLDLNVERDSCSPNSHVNAVESNLLSKDVTNMNEVLKIGMEFESDEHAYIFYNKYAGLVGFNVRKDWVNRSKIHGQVVSRKFTCSREGYRRRDKRDVNVRKHRKETRTGCLAHMIVTRKTDGKYQVTHFEANHNHENVSLSIAKILQELSQGVIGVSSVTESDSAKTLEIQSKLEFQLLRRRFGNPENLDHLAIDYDNHLTSARTRDIKEGEAGRLLYYFQRQHFENPSFYYAIQLDVDDKISNIFWADDHMLLDYDHFGDVVCLDTIYRTSNDFRPLVQFIGQNHHKQVVVFGAALVYDETIDSLTWLLKTFIEAMSGKKPKAIHTDQDVKVVQAINSVFPETNHRVCVWQMYQNAIKHLSHVTQDRDAFATDFRSCLYDHEDEEDFIHAWNAMLEKFSLQQNEWLRWIFREKDKWALACGRNTFFVDMNGKHVGESLSDNLRNCLNPEINVLQFFKHFESMVNEQRYKELEASYDMGRCAPRLMGNVILLKHASEKYTPKAFEAFQREYEKCLNVVVNKCSQNDTFLEYKAYTFGKPTEYKVMFNSLDAAVTCSCMKFEYVGVLCCHALKVLDHQNIKELPAQYILHRWTKNARVGSEGDSYGCTRQENAKFITASRYKDLCLNILKISARAAESDQAFKYAASQLDEVMQGVERIMTTKYYVEAQAITSSSTGVNATESEQTEIFLDRDATENQDVNDILKGTDEIENIVPGEDQVNHFSERISNMSRSLNSCTGILNK